MGDAYLKERLAICNEEDTDGRARVERERERDRTKYGRLKIRCNFSDQKQCVKFGPLVIHCDVST